MPLYLRVCTPLKIFIHYNKEADKESRSGTGKYSMREKKGKKLGPGNERRIGEVAGDRKWREGEEALKRGRETARQQLYVLLMM